MTVEEKALAYDEAVARAKRTLDCLAEDYLCTHMTKDDVRYQYAQLFPEFREDEDTMMMRKLIYGLQTLLKQGKETFAGADIEDLLDYLERESNKKDESKVDYETVKKSVLEEFGLSGNGYDPMNVLWTIKKKWPMAWDKMLHAEMNIGDKWSKPAVEDGDDDELIRKKLISLINWSGTRWDSKDKDKFIEYLNHCGHPKIGGIPISTENNTVNIPLPGASTTFEQDAKAAEKRYNEEYSTGEYCHEQSFKWGFQEGVDWHKSRLCDVGLIQRSWYMEGFHDGKFGREPMWYIKTGKGGPKHERNKNYTPPIGKDKILREIERELDTWEEAEERAMKNGCGLRGSTGDLCQITTAELCNELFWRLKSEN